MLISSARALKAELLENRALRTVATRASLPAFARELASALPDERKPTAVALGVARHGRSCQLAVRVQHAFPGVETLLDQIRERARGEVDIRFVGRGVKQSGAVPWHRRNQRPLKLGCSISHIFEPPGTLGAFVTRDGEPDLILSSRHVLVSDGADDDSILQRAAADGGDAPEERVARLERAVPLERTRANLVDCATARIEAGIEYEFDFAPAIGFITGIRTTNLQCGETVFKVGRSTGRTEGAISCNELDDLKLDYAGLGELAFDDQIEIKSVDGVPFSLGGDSGALVLDADGLAVGLLFGGNDCDTSWANPIRTVLDALAVRLVY
jgi:hypothetical protein